MSVLVFKTNMVHPECVQIVAHALSRFGTAIRWNTDLDDSDKILRIETQTISADDIVQVMHDAGFVCQELV
ncbi:hypothetical protein GCM10027341_39340 [Spirosoma knui]